MKKASILLCIFCTLTVTSCSAMRDFITKRQAIVIRKLNKTLTIPAFSVASGQAKGSLNGIWSNVPGLAENLTTVSCETWFKPNTSFYSVLGQGILGRSFGGIFQYQFGLTSTLKMEATFRKGGVYQTFTGTTTVSHSDWSFLSFCWDGTTVRFFINGVLTDSGALASPLDSVPGAADFTGSVNLASHIDEIRLWHEDRAGIIVNGVSDLILGSMLFPRNITAGDSVDDNLKAYYKMDTLFESISGTAVVPVSTSIDTEEFAPIKFGTSWIVKTFAVTNTVKCSIHRNTDWPDEPNHGLYVSWIDDDGDLQRRRLYGAEPDEIFGVETIHPTPADYNGEALPTTFNLEFWNIDGLETTDLEEDLVIKTSVTNAHSSHRSHTQSAISTPVGTSTLYDAYPLGNPITRETTQSY